MPEQVGVFAAARGFLPFHLFRFDEGDARRQVFCAARDVHDKAEQASGSKHDTVHGSPPEWIDAPRMRRPLDSTLRARCAPRSDRGYTLGVRWKKYDGVAFLPWGLLPF